MKIRLGQRLGPCQEKPPSRNEEVCSKERAKWRLHPSIHTIASGNSAQNLVAWSKKEKCGLKYVIHNFRRVVEEFIC